MCLEISFSMTLRNPVVKVMGAGGRGRVHEEAGWGFQHPKSQSHHGNFHLKEMQLYSLYEPLSREVFEKNFPNQGHFMPYFWMPQWTDAKDTSARFISHYAADKQ